MPLDPRFYRAVEPLYFSGMGTEHVAPLLYTLVRMTRPRSVLEVGLGYTTPFLAQALEDNVAEFESDRRILAVPGADEERQLLLAPDHYAEEYNPKLYAIDDFSDEGSSGPEAIKVIESLGLESRVEVEQGDFHGRSRQMNRSAFPLDLVWFDCGGLPEYVDFIQEYWRLINPEHGLLLLHFTYWNLSYERDGVRQQAAAGLSAEFEVLSLLEPHKQRQGSVTMIRKLGWASRCRDRDFGQEVFDIFGAKYKPMIRLQ
jgi:predicted O-methyltransferase YrrM